mmetsp:Transcript_27193/g.61701  ORF Transcript_27193/g.61701 Transcript_27193/m.61701 type:complete len:117 (+) Transcript_27193:77-427(+)
MGSKSELAPHGHAPANAFWAAVVGILCKLRYLGLAGYAVEWILEAAHVSKRLHHWLHRFRLNSPKVHLFAITLVLAGHLAEHAHQEEENHHQEERMAILEARLAAVQPSGNTKKTH